MAARPSDPNPDKKGAGPTLALIILGLIVVLFAAFLILRPKPPGAVDNGKSPAAQH